MLSDIKLVYNICKQDEKEKPPDTSVCHRKMSMWIIRIIHFGKEEGDGILCVVFASIAVIILSKRVIILICK